jgi:hypothetical protein
VNDYLRLRLTYPLLSACCCWRLYFADLRGELNTHLGPSGFVYLEFSWRNSHCYKLSPFQAHRERWHCTSFLRPVYLQFTWEVGLPPSLVEFSSHRHFYKVSCSWLLSMCCCSCLLRLAYLFTVPWRISSPLLFSAQGAPPSFLHIFFITYYSVFFFPGGRSVQGLCWSGPGFSVGVPCAA